MENRTSKITERVRFWNCASDQTVHHLPDAFKRCNGHSRSTLRVTAAILTVKSNFIESV